MRWTIRVIDSAIKLGCLVPRLQLSAVGKHRPSKVCPTTHQAGPDDQGGVHCSSKTAVSQADVREEILCHYSRVGSVALDSCHAAVRGASLAVRKSTLRLELQLELQRISGKCYFKLVLFRNVHIHKALLSHIYFFSPYLVGYMTFLNQQTLS